MTHEIGPGLPGPFLANRQVKGHFFSASSAASGRSFSPSASPRSPNLKYVLEGCVQKSSSFQLPKIHRGAVPNVLNPQSWIREAEAILCTKREAAI
jgi:hypothetical protein